MYYKVLPKNMCAYGYQYRIGLNRMEHPEQFGETLVCQDDGYEAGLYFADADNILAYCHYGELIATVEIADGARLSYWGAGEYSTDALVIENIRPLWNIETLRQLEKEGVNFSADNNAILSWAEELSKSDIVKYLQKSVFG